MSKYATQKNYPGVELKQNCITFLMENELFLSNWNSSTVINALSGLNLQALYDRVIKCFRIASVF